MANCEPFDMYAMTAASKSLPLGCFVEVTNLENGNTCKVEITDRGPYVEGRVIDVSYGVAEVLEMTEQGVVEVRIEVIAW